MSQPELVEGLVRLEYNTRFDKLSVTTENNLRLLAPVLGLRTTASPSNIFR